jgi:predicted Zn-dependent protease
LLLGHHLKTKTMNSTRVWSLIALAGCLLAFTGCQTAPITGRKGLNLISTDQEMQLGLSSFEQLKKETPINKDPALNAMVTRVGGNIARVAAKDMPSAKWEFVVFESKEANAFCLPGGKVGVYTGILPITKTEAGLATVLGHEVAHAVAHHGAERMSQQMVVETGGALLASGLGKQDPACQKAAMIAYGLGSQVGVLLPYSREHESEADHIGLIYMARAGYNPEEAVAFWERFSAYTKASGGTGTPGFLRTHPLDEVRIKQLKAWLPEAKAQTASAPPK